MIRALSEVEVRLPEWRPPQAGAVVMRPLAILTLGGNLLPRFLRRRPPAVIYVQYRSVMASVFRDEILLRYVATAEGITVTRDRRRAFSLLRRARRVGKRISAEYDSVAAAYRAAEPEMTSARFWERKFADPAS